MDLRQLRYFVAIVEHGSLSRAALALRVAQPALSLHVRNMEADFGASLLFRSAQGVRPTQAGEILVRDARLIIRQLEETRQEIRGYGAEPQGEICLGFPSALSRAMVGRLLVDAKRLYPKLRLNVVEAMSGFVLEWLRRGRVDIGLLFAPVHDKKMECRTLLSEDLLLMGLDQPPDDCPVIDGTEVCFTQLARLPLVTGKRGHGLRDLLEAKAAEVGTTLNVAMEIESHACIGSMVKERIGYTLTTASTFDRGPDAERFRTWRIKDPGMRMSLYAVHGMEQPLSVTMKAVLDLCATSLGGAEPARTLAMA